MTTNHPSRPPPCGNQGPKTNFHQFTLAFVAALVLGDASARAQCLNSPVNTNGMIDRDLSTSSQEPSIGIDDAGRVLLAYRTVPQTIFQGSRLFVLRLDTSGECIGGAAEIGTARQNDQASVAMLDDPAQPSSAVVAWIESPAASVVNPLEARLHRTSVAFDAFAPSVGTFLSDATTNAVGDIAPSAAIGDGVTALAFANLNRTCATDCDRGLVHSRNSTASITQIEDCSPYCENGEITSFWQPAVAANCGGFYAVVYAIPEDPLDFTSPPNILLQFNQPDGTVIGAAIQVNQPVSSLQTAERSPAVAMDCNSNIVVAWGGRSADPCNIDGISRPTIFARRFKWDGIGLNPPYPVGDQFVAQCYTCDATAPVGVENGRPTVALSNDPDHKGRFVLAWNVGTAPFHDHVRARLYESDGAARGLSFRVDAGLASSPVRFMARSARHTLQYGRDGRVVVAWNGSTSFNGANPVAGFTILTPEFVNLAPGRRGDCNYDDRVDGDDIPVFVNNLISSPGTACNTLPTADRSICGFDCNLDGSLSTADVPFFVCLLLNGEAACTDVCGNPATTAQDGGAYSGYGGEQMAMGGGESMMGGESQGSAWEPWFTWEQVRDFAQWLKANPRSAHPEMTDEQYYRSLRRAMKDIGLWRE